MLGSFINGRELMKMQTEHFFRCLADPVRFNIVLLLLHKQGELCSCELADSLGQNLSSVSRHLVLLRNKGVVTERREELWLYYQINQHLPKWAKEILNNAYHGNQHRLVEPLAAMQSLDARRICVAS